MNRTDTSFAKRCHFFCELELSDCDRSPQGMTEVKTIMARPQAHRLTDHFSLIPLLHPTVLFSALEHAWYSLETFVQPVRTYQCQLHHDVSLVHGIVRTCDSTLALDLRQCPRLKDYPVPPSSAFGSTRMLSKPRWHHDATLTSLLDFPVPTSTSFR